MGKFNPSWMKLAFVFAALALASMAFVACGSDDSDSTEAAETTSESKEDSSEPTADAPTGPPIKIGTIYTGSGPLAEGFAILGKVYENWVTVTNEEGGINGHPVELVVKSEASNTAEASRQARELVTQDKVMAIVGTLSTSEESWAEIPAEADIPVVGGSYFSAPSYTNPNNFPVGASLITSYYGMMDQAKKSGVKKTAAIYCAEAPVCAVVETLQKGIAEDVIGGIDFAAGVSVLSTSPNFKAPCLKVKEVGAELLYIGFPPGITRRVLEECSTQNVEAPVTTSTGGLGIFDSEKPGVEGATAIVAALPVAAEAGAASERQHEILGDLMEDEELSDTVSTPIAGLEMFKVAAELGEIGPTSTSDDLKKALYQVKDETLGGMTGPITYTPGKPLDVNCYFVAKVEDGSWTSDGKYTCVPPKKLEEVLGLLG